MKRLCWQERAGLLIVVLLAWALRWVLLMEVPPGWRDDDLIELYTFSEQIVREGPMLYFAGASGHEPLFHTLRAAIIAGAGINQASARWLSATAGTLVALLTWAVGRRLLGRKAGLTAAVLVSLSFWSLMYSRVAIRHIGVLPWALIAIYWAWRLLRSPALSRRATASAIGGIALGTGGALLTYYAGRLMPVLLGVAFPLLSPRRGRWRAYLIGTLLGSALALPMFWTAARLPGADARVSELALPIHALREGDPWPLLNTAWATVGMAHARGDPEWLYNTSERPVFGAAGAALFYLALVMTLVRWRDPAARFLLLWLAAGIGPALISLPPSSYGHTILALPAVYLVLASLVTLPGRLLVARAALRPTWHGRAIAAAVAAALIVVVGARDLSGYFIDWPRHGMVRFLYRADYRGMAHHTDSSPTDIAIGTMLYGPWDKVAWMTDSPHAGSPRWIDPRRALVFVQGSTTRFYLPDVLVREIAPPTEPLWAAGEVLAAPEGVHGYQLDLVTPGARAIRQGSDGRPLASTPYAGSLALDAAEVWDAGTTGTSLWVATWWTVRDALPLPEEELIPNPPPPGVYNGPRLKVFAHLGTGDEVFSIDDGLWVDPYSLSPGDVMVQFSHFTLPEDAPATLALRLGLYDPLTGERWTTATGADYLELNVER